jgi:hypothetical protein
MSINEESLFAEAQEMKDPKERAAFLDRACADDPVLRKNMDSLLSAYDAGQFLETPAATIAAQPVSEGLGMQIGPYKLLRRLRSGLHDAPEALAPIFFLLEVDGLAVRGDATLSGITIEGGAGAGFGGGITNFGGTLTVSASILCGNSATEGGGIRRPGNR